MSTWREQMEDLAASVWTNRKASPGDVRADIAKIIGVHVPMEQEDALQTLNEGEIQKVLVGLQIETDYVMDHSDLCPELAVATLSHEVDEHPGVGKETTAEECERRIEWEIEAE